MLVRFYNKDKGIFSQNLVDSCDGVIELSFIDADGKSVALMDAVGDREKWTFHARTGCTLETLLTDSGNGEYAFASPCEYAVAEDGYACRITARNGAVFFVICADMDENKKVQLIALPLNRKIMIGYADECDIRTSFPVVSDRHVQIERSTDGIVVQAIDESEVFINGCFLNSQKVTKSDVGDVVDIYGMRIVCMNDFIAIYISEGVLSIKQSIKIYTPHATTIPAPVRTAVDEDEVFNRSPRIYMKHEVTKFNLDSPPAQDKGEEMPLALSMGSSAMMGMSSILMATMSLQSALEAGRGFMSVLPSVLMSSGMFVGSLVMPIISRKYTNAQREKKEKKRNDRYMKYLSDKEAEIENLSKLQKQILEETYPNLETLKNYLFQRNNHLWERMLNHSDFLDLRLGLAQIDVDMELNNPGEHFNMDDDRVRERFEKFMHKKRVIDDAPLMLPLRKIQMLGIFGSYEQRMKYISALIIQLCIQHSYKELKLVLIFPQTAQREWEFARWLPHCWNDDFSQRFMGCTKDDMHMLSPVLQTMCFSTRETRQEDEQLHTVVIIADLKLAENCRALINAMAKPEAYPFSVIALAERPGELPKECHSVIALKDNGGTLFRDIRELEKADPFSYDDMTTVPYIRPIALKLRHTKLASDDAERALPNSITFFEMLRVGNVRQLNAPLRWKNSNPIRSLAAPVGVDKDGALLYMDIHQDAHGPHGLVAGTTGSGKSEFLISYLISVAAYYDPLEVGFILIDYKGGGMSDTLKSLPHVVGVIDNLDGKLGIRRSMVCITSELKRRQRIFKEVGDKLGVKNMDIHKYQKLYRSGDVNEPLQHLIIVSDEFAELKQQEPEFMDDLVSAARIGRSLGVHLILATQKPTGVVNDQILSNTRFRVCMKVQDRSDSMSMIGKPDAAMITQTGRFYFQVGMDEVFSLGQSAWSGADATENDYFVQEPDNSIEVVDERATVIGKAIPKAYVKSNADGAKTEKQVDAIVKYLFEEAEKTEKIPRQIWLPMLKPQVTLSQLGDKYKEVYLAWEMRPLVGEVDDPMEQAQYAFRPDICGGNMLLMGMAGSGQEEFVRNMIYSLCMNTSPEEVNLYSLDFSTEATRAFRSMPHVGDVMGNGEDEKIFNLFSWLEKESARRRVQISDYGGSIEMLRQESKQKMPYIVIFIQNLAAFTEAYENLEDAVYTLARDASGFGIYFVVTANNTRSVRSRMMQVFPQVFCFQMNDEMEYQNLLGKNDGIVPGKRKGSGIFKDNGRVLEFQVADIFAEEEGSMAILLQLGYDQTKKWKGAKAERVKVLPQIVALSDITSDASAVALDKVPVGIHTTKLETVYWDIKANSLNMLLYKDKTDSRFVECLAAMLSLKKDRRVYVLDTGEVIDRQYPASFEVARTDKELCKLTLDMFNTVLSRHKKQKADLEQGVASEFDEIVLFVGSVGRLTEVVKNAQTEYEQLSDKLDALLNHVNKALGISVVFVCRPQELSGLSLRSWYTKIDRTAGIWLGNGIMNQQMLNVSNLSMKEAISEGAFGYAVRNERAVACKLLQKVDT